MLPCIFQEVELYLNGGNFVFRIPAGYSWPQTGAEE